MSSIFSFIQDYIYVYLWLILTTFINIVAPLAGSVTVNPVTAYFTDPQRAIGIGAFIFACSGLHRVYLFRTEIFNDEKNIRIIKVLLPYSILGALAGAFVLVSLNTKVLVILIVLASFYFIYKTILQLYRPRTIEHEGTHLGKAGVSIISGFLQGSGMPGSEIRNNYLRTILSEKSVRAVGSVEGVPVLFISGITVLLHNHLIQNDLIFVVSIVPILLVAQSYGKMFLDKIPDTHAKIIAIAFSLLGVGLLTYKYLI